MGAQRVLEETTLPLKGRRVRRVIRKVDPWSVLKVSILFYVCIFVVVLVAGIVLWLVAAGLGVISNVENFIGDLFALTDFHFEAGQILRAAAVGGGIVVVLGSAANVLAAILYNLISDVVGGVEVAILEEEPVSRSVV